MRMRKTMLLVLALAAPALADTTWQIDPAHTTVGFSVRHMTVSNVRGVFRKVSGTVHADDADLSRSTIEATIDAASIDTGDAKRDEHLRSPDFLDVAQYPTMTFRSTKLERAGDGRWKVTGDLTLHGVTRPVVLDVEGPTPAIKGARGETRSGAAATTRLDRQDFGIVWSKALDGGGLVVGNDLAITIDAEAVKP
jgi:polyisoprenoid-binding protein YceI